CCLRKGSHEIRGRNSTPAGRRGRRSDPIASLWQLHLEGSIRQRGDTDLHGSPVSGAARESLKFVGGKRGDFTGLGCSRTKSWRTDKNQRKPRWRAATVYCGSPEHF